MNLELEKKIIESFPKLFYCCHVESRYPICFGIETHDGWYQLIYDTCQQIQDWCDRKNKSVRFTQIKEKFGALRIYCEIRYNAIEEIIEKASEESITICEYCGSRDKVTATKGWINYLCEGCKKKTQRS